MKKIRYYIVKEQVRTEILFFMKEAKFILRFHIINLKRRRLKYSYNNKKLQLWQRNYFVRLLPYRNSRLKYPEENLSSLL